MKLGDSGPIRKENLHLKFYIQRNNSVCPFIGLTVATGTNRDFNVHIRFGLVYLYLRGHHNMAPHVNGGTFLGPKITRSYLGHKVT